MGRAGRTPELPDDQPGQQHRREDDPRPRRDPEKRSPARTWNNSCPGTPAPTTSAPGQSHPGSPANPCPPQITTAPPTRTGHAGYCHARSQDFRILTLRAHLTRDGSDIADWGKYTTRTHHSPSGDFQVHYYYNPTTGAVAYDFDYKVVMNAR